LKRVWREMAITLCYSLEFIWEQLKETTVSE
jgi:hypothetical protein